jgi:sterol desaturase/sphingolipid hydroxylase (fatty acid hydroxylase superfamily)
MYIFEWYMFLPLMTFLLLLIGELTLPKVKAIHKAEQNNPISDWVINLIGLFMQGIVVPILSMTLSFILFPRFFPGLEGSLKIGTIGAFCLNFIGVDFLYYWQHRWFHQIPLLWRLHECHHTAKEVNIWVTSRNSILVQFIFVYLLINPILGFLCDDPKSFYLAAMITASLDILKHTEIDFNQIPLLNRIIHLLSPIFIMPKEHHQHHNATNINVNFGANLFFWDRWFGTAQMSDHYPSHYSKMEV